MTKLDWTTLLTAEQLKHARYVYETDRESPRFRDMLINEVLISMDAPPTVEKDMENGFLRAYAGYSTPAAGRSLAEFLKSE